MAAATAPRPSTPSEYARIGIVMTAAIGANALPTKVVRRLSAWDLGGVGGVDRRAGRSRACRPPVELRIITQIVIAEDGWAMNHALQGHGMGIS